MASRFSSHLVPVFVLTLLLVIQAAAAIATTSGTFDETLYLAMALRAYREGNVLPFVALGVAPLPIFLCYFLPAIRSASVLVSPDSYAYLITLARVSAVTLVGVPLVLLVYMWLTPRCDRLTSFMAAAMIALSPNVVAHASVATTDACFTLTALIALGVLAIYLERPSALLLIVLAVSMGLAFAAKYTAVMLLPTAFAAVVSWPRTPQDAIVSRLTRAVGVSVVLLAGAFVVPWAFHGFAITRAEIGTWPVISVPAPIASFLVQLEHNRVGHPAFLLGDLSPVGWWYYMPVALLLKSTPAELFVFGLAVIAYLTRWGNDTAAMRVLRLAFFICGSALIFSYVNIGVRYALLLYPLAVLGASRFATIAAASTRGRAAMAMLVLAQASSAVMIAPHYLSYFNRLSGGPANGYRYLADSNVDWGQDLPALKRSLETVGARRPLIAYFGTAPLEAYGIDALPWSCGRKLEAGSADWVVISATYLDGVYVPDDTFAGFREIPPSARAGYSMLLYATDRADVRDALTALSKTCI